MAHQIGIRAATLRRGCIIDREFLGGRRQCRPRFRSARSGREMEGAGELLEHRRCVARRIDSDEDRLDSCRRDSGFGFSNAINPAIRFCTSGVQMSGQFVYSRNRRCDIVRRTRHPGPLSSHPDRSALKSPPMAAPASGAADNGGTAQAHCCRQARKSAADRAKKAWFCSWRGQTWSAKASNIKHMVADNVGSEIR